MTALNIITVTIEAIWTFIKAFFGTTWAIFKGVVTLKSEISTFQDIIQAMLIPLSIFAIVTGIIRQIVKRNSNKRTK